MPRASESPHPAGVIARLAKLIEIALALEGTTLNQYRMLCFVEEGTPPIAEVAQRLAMKPPNVSALVEVLVQRDYVVRERAADDGRRWHLSLTAEGRQCLSKAETSVARVIDAILHGRDDAVTLRDSLTGWSAVLDERERLLRSRAVD